MGVTPGMLLDAESRGSLPAEALGDVQRMIAAALIWVFVMMAAVAVLQWAVVLRMPRQRKADHAVGAAEALEAAVG
jgi:hypothetical protein